MEEFKDIAGYPGYRVSSQGYIISTKRGKATLLTSSISGSGYTRVNLSRDNKATTLYVHRLVAAAFCPGYSPELDVNHKDGDNTNNRADNLEWITHSDNMKHAWRLGKFNRLVGESSHFHRSKRQTTR